MAKTSPRRRTPARDSRGRFIRRRRTVAASAKPVRRRTVAASAEPVRRRRKRRYTMPRKYHYVRAHHRRGTFVRAHMSNPYFRRRRRYRRNPDFFGFAMPDLKTVGYTVAGVAGTPFVEGLVSGTVINTLGVQDKTMRTVVTYALKLASAYGISYAVGMFAGREAKTAALIGGLSYVGVSALSDLGLLPGAKVSTASSTGRYLAAQPLLGAYSPKIGSAVTAFAPGRLQPASRF